MRKLFLQLLLLGLLQQTYAQIGVGLQGSYIAPSGDEKYSLKPTICTELKINIREFDSRFKLAFAIGYARFKPTQDTFKIYGTQTGGSNSYGFPVNGTQLQPGYEHIYNYSVGSVGFISDFKILNKKFSPTFGLDFYTYLFTLNEDYSVEGQINLKGEDENELSYGFAFIPHAGLSYEFKDNWLFAGSFGRSMTFYGSAALHAFWKSSLSVSYCFE